MRCVAAVGNAAAALQSLVTAIITMIVVAADLFLSAFPLATDLVLRLAKAGAVKVNVLVSQTGKGVAAFVTNLFKVAGRTYHWQAGPVS